MSVKFKHVAEYVSLRILGGLMGILPYRVALGLGWIIAALAFYVFRFRVAEARRRIKQVFSDRFSEREIRRITWLSLRNLSFNAVEIFRMPRLTRAWVDRHVEMPGINSAYEHIDMGRGGIFATMHMGNWDLSGVGSHLVELPVFFIARRQKNPFTDDYLNRMRGITGVETLLNDGRIFKKVFRRLRNGDFLGILPDVRHREPALSIRFLGGEANIAAGTGLFARQNNVPIFPVVSRRLSWTRHQFHYMDPIHPDPRLDKQADIVRMTQAVMDLFDAEIRKTPDQYFWFNKRWILDPLEASPHDSSEPDHMA